MSGIFYKQKKNKILTSAPGRLYRMPKTEGGPLQQVFFQLKVLHRVFRRRALFRLRFLQTGLFGFKAAAPAAAWTAASLLLATAPAEAGRFGRHFARPVFFNQNTGTAVIGRFLEEEEIPEPVRRTVNALKQGAARFDIEKTAVSDLLKHILTPSLDDSPEKPSEAAVFKEENPLYFAGFARNIAVLKTVGVENRSHQDILILKDFSFVFYEQFKDFDSSWFHKGFVINSEGKITGVLAALRQNENAESEMFLIKITPEMIKILSQEQKTGSRPTAAAAKPQDSPDDHPQNQSGGPDGGGGGSSREPAPAAIFQDKGASDSGGGLVSRFRQAVAPEGGARSERPQLLLIKSGGPSEQPMTEQAEKRDGGGAAGGERASNEKAKGRIPPFFGPAKPAAGGGDVSPPRNNAEARIERAVLRAADKLNPLTAVPEGGGKGNDCQGLFDPPPQTD